MGKGRGTAVAIVVLAATLRAAPARGFELIGHQVIEAVAYRRLLSMDAVPGTGVSGRAVLASLIQGGVLFTPPCFDSKLGTDCGPEARADRPLRFWPPIGSGSPDLVLDRQIGQRGQCQHFMAQTADGMAPYEPRYSAPAPLAIDAYERCVQITGLVIDGILRDPHRAQWHLAGTYVLMHAIEDSFSAAHVDRDEHLKVKHLLSWTLIDWPWYALHGRLTFPPETHHRVTDERDAEFLRWNANAPDGRSCRSLLHPYAVPEECLTENAKASVNAIVDLLVLLYQLRARAAAEGREATLFSPSSTFERTRWLAYLHEHVDGVSASPTLPDKPREPLPRPDVFVGFQGIAGPRAWGVGAWGARLFFVRPAIPFALAWAANAGYGRGQDGEHVSAGTGVGLLLPLVRRFTIGALPVGVRVECATDFHHCTPDAVATLGVLLIPLGIQGWLGVTGPQWSWTDRTVGDTWGALSLGFSHEAMKHRDPPSAAAATEWNPPRFDEVRAYRTTRSTRALYVAASAGSSADQSFIGAGFEWRRDRDMWNQRSGFALGAQAEVDQNGLGGGARAGGVAFGPTVRWYVLPDKLALTATPALVRAGALATRGLGIDVAARVGLAFDLDNVELSVDSFPLSYLPDGSREALPLSVRLGLLVD